MIRDIEDVFKIIENLASRTCRVLQIILFLLVFIIITVFSCYFVNNLITINNANLHPQLVIAYLSIGIYMLYNIVYNYVMCYTVGPGHPFEIKNQIFQQKIRKRCKKCGIKKPIRTHHCSICGKCILQMDHHCPWMGTCVGHYNRQYFINFLTYVTSVSFFYVQMMREFRLPHQQVYIFMLTIAVVIGAFTLFHWCLVLCGRTTLQLCQITDGYQPCAYSILNNLEIVYGTKNILKVLLPYPRKLPFIGFEWNDLLESKQIWIEDQIFLQNNQ